MYQPNFCSECGAKIIRLHWRPWSSRRFCDSCSRRLRKERLTVPLVAALALFGVGLFAGRAGRPEPPPLIIERQAHSPLFGDQGEPGEKEVGPDESGLPRSNAPPNTQPESASEPIYICGARTKKGRPCSRRVHGAVRCWQHKGMPAMLQQEKLLVSDKL